MNDSINHFYRLLGYQLSRRQCYLAGFSKYMPHQGEQEKARRRRQIAAGFITPSCA